MSHVSIEDTRRHQGLALALAGVIALTALMLLMPPPAKFEQLGVSIPRGDSSAWFAARGPAFSRYDAETDTTDALFHCSHQYCESVVRLAGDQRASLDRPHVLLRATRGPFLREPLAEPFLLPASSDAPPGREVTTYFSGEWRAYSPWMSAIPFAIAGSAVAAGLTLLVSRAPRGAMIGVLCAGVLALVAARELNWMTLFLFPIFAAPLLAVIAGAGALAARRWPRARVLPWACGVFAITFVILTAALNAFFPTAPEL